MNINNLKKARETAGYTQIQVAKMLSISDGTYKNYEQGNREPKGDMIVQLANLFNVSTDYLLGKDSGEPDALDILSNQFNMSDVEKRTVKRYFSLPRSERDKLVALLRSVLYGNDMSNDDWSNLFIMFVL